MTVKHFPGDFRIGALNTPMNGTEDPTPSLLAPKFLVLILLRGKQKFYLGDDLIELSAGMENDQTPVGFAVLIKKPCELRFVGSWGDPFRKVSIAGPPDWFEELSQESSQTSTLPNFPQHHLEHMIWRPTRETVRLATQIILAPPEESDRQAGLFRMSRGLEILRRVPEESKQEKNSVPAPHLKTTENLRLYILQNIKSDLSLDQLEKIFGLNRRSIQRNFKQEYGIGVSEFIRSQRLNQANLALQHDGISIAAAAHIAGYTNAANFATAFRRVFGASPKSVQNRTV